MYQALEIQQWTKLITVLSRTLLLSWWETTFTYNHLYKKLRRKINLGKRMGNGGGGAMCVHVYLWRPRREKIRSYLEHVKFEMPNRHLRKEMLSKQPDTCTWGEESLVGVSSKKKEGKRKTRDRNYEHSHLRTFAKRKQDWKLEEITVMKNDNQMGKNEWHSGKKELLKQCSWVGLS